MTRLKRIINQVVRSSSLSTLFALLMMATVLSCSRSKTGKKGGATPKQAQVTNNHVKYQLEVQGLEENIVSATNKFSLKITKDSKQVLRAVNIVIQLQGSQM